MLSTHVKEDILRMYAIKALHVSHHLADYGYVYVRVYMFCLCARAFINQGTLLWRMSLLGICVRTLLYQSGHLGKKKVSSVSMLSVHTYIIHKYTDTYTHGVQPEREKVTRPYIVCGHCCESGDLLTPAPGMHKMSNSLFPLSLSVSLCYVLVCVCVCVRARADIAANAAIY